MDQRITDILNDAKYRNQFPPREAVVRIKCDLAGRGNLRSGAAVTRITSTYLDSTEAVLVQFIDVVLKNRTNLDVASEDEIVGLVDAAFNTVIAEARECTLSEFPDEQIKNLATNLFNEKASPLLEHLKRKARLMELDLGGIMSSVQISGGQIGNLVIGSVNKSALYASVHQIIGHGGTEAEIGRGIEDLLQAIAQMEENRKAEQDELYDLIKGLMQQIKLPKEERSPSSIKVIWERIVEVSQVSAEVAKLVQSLVALLGGLLAH